MRTIGALACALAACTALASPAIAQPGAQPGPAARSGPNATPPGEVDDSAGATPLGRLALAQELFRLARLQRDPIVAAAAVRLAAPVQSRDMARAPVEQLPGRASAKTSSLGPPELPEMLALARQLAAGDPALLRQIDLANQPSDSRGRVAGPGLTRSRIEAGGRTTYQGQDTVFRGGEPAQVLLTGDGDADLDLFVVDELGNEVCRSEGPTDREYCSWTPRWTGQFRIIIVNSGSVWNSFALRTN